MPPARAHESKPKKTCLKNPKATWWNLDMCSSWLNGLMVHLVGRFKPSKTTICHKLDHNAPVLDASQFYHTAYTKSLTLCPLLVVAAWLPLEAPAVTKTMQVSLEGCKTRLYTFTLSYFSDLASLSLTWLSWWSACGWWMAIGWDGGHGAKMVEAGPSLGVKMAGPIFDEGQPYPNDSPCVVPNVWNCVSSTVTWMRMLLWETARIYGRFMKSLWWISMMQVVNETP